MDKYILFIIGLALFIFTGRGLIVWVILKLNGVKTVATVYEVVRGRDEEDDDSYIGISYELNRRRVYNRLPYSSYQVGDSVSIIYNPKNPSQIGYADYIPIQEIFWFGISLLLVVVGLFIAVKG